MKTAKTFRLSEQALQAIEYLSNETGTNDTAILEMALAYYRQAYNSAKLVDFEKLAGGSLSRHVIENVRIADPVHKKKRKRH
jgi:hypothetical protein